MILWIAAFAALAAFAACSGDDDGGDGGGGGVPVSGSPGTSPAGRPSIARSRAAPARPRPDMGNGRVLRVAREGDLYWTQHTGDGVRVIDLE